MCEKLHIKFVKFILRVHSKTTNQAVLSEIGRFPIYFDIIKSMLNYWQILEYMDSFPISQSSYKHSKKLYMKNRSSWFRSLQKIFQIIPGFLNIKFKIQLSKEYVVKSLRKHLLALWKEKMNNCSDGKLQTYTQVKTSCGCEKYLILIRNFEPRRSICKFRVSSHHLQIELGRYKGIPRHLRLCQQCSSGEVGDEIYFLFKCSKYERDRTALIDIILTSCPNSNSLNDIKKLEWICNCENHNILTHLGVFLRKHCR